MGNQIISRASYCILQITLFLFGSSAFAQSNDKVSGKLQVEEASISDIHSAIESRSATCEEIVEQYLARIEAYNLNGPSINAVITVNPNAIGEAAQLDATFAQNGFTGPLHCTTVLVKDQVETNDMPTTYGSALFAGFIPLRNATIIDKIESAGGLSLAKQLWVSSHLVTQVQLLDFAAMSTISLAVPVALLVALVLVLLQALPQLGLQRILEAPQEGLLPLVML